MTRQFTATLQGLLEKHMVNLAGEEASVARQLMAIQDDLCFIWSTKESCVLAIHLDRGSDQCTRLIPTGTPLFDVEKLSVSKTGRWLSLWGSRGATALELPRRTGKMKTFVGVESDGSVVVHSVAIAERFFLSNPRIILQEAQWHPGSLYDGHLMVLTSDNVLRSFNLDLEQDSPEESLFLSGSADYTNERRFFGQSALSVRGSLGETAVSFSFAPPISNGNDPDPPLWPVFILCGDGSVYFVVLGHKEDKKPRVMGPLPMLPESEDNYGTDACAILTLHPMISSPPIVVIATTKGTLYHCIVLQKCDDSDLDTASQISDWSTSVTGLENVPIDLVLHVYESVELELSLLSDDDKKPFDYPLLLSVDPFTPSRYFCSHKAGVHSVSLPMVAQLAELAQASDESVAKGLVPMEQSSIVQHLICTQLFSGQIGCPMQGLALSFPPARMHCILGDYKAVTVALSKAVKVSEPQPLLCTTTQHDPVKPTKESFEMHIQQMLQRSTCNPLMKSNEIMTSEECYEILARSTKVLREEYISRMEKARSEIEKRTAGLKARKSQQIKSVSNLTDERFCLRENAAQLSEKYEDLRDNQDNLVSRIEAVLHAIQRRLPVTSDSEVRMHRQLQNIEKKVKDLSNALEQIKAKERYQMKQIKHSQENIKTRSEVVNQLGQNQAESMKDVLRQDGEQIADVIKRLNGLKKEVAM